METYFKTLDGKIWVQVDGCPIGKSISGEIAEIYMNWFEETYVFNETNVFKPIFWKRMRDDILLIWKKGDLIELDLPMEPRYVFANEKVKNLHGMVVLASGPIVYGLEKFDNPELNSYRIDINSPISQFIIKQYNQQKQKIKNETNSTTTNSTINNNLTTPTPSLNNQIQQEEEIYGPIFRKQH